MDKIVLSGLEFYARHGVFDEENTLGARFVVDVELFLPLPETDVLSETVDYGDDLQPCTTRDTGQALQAHRGASASPRHPNPQRTTARTRGHRARPQAARAAAGNRARHMCRGHAASLERSPSSRWAALGRALGATQVGAASLGIFGRGGSKLEPLSNHSVGGPEGQRDYLNAAVVLRPEVSEPEALLKQLLGLEAEAAANAPNAGQRGL